jgi:hypothetical protein
MLATESEMSPILALVSEQIRAQQSGMYVCMYL